jgi:hypothetical protein
LRDVSSSSVESALIPIVAEDAFVEGAKVDETLGRIGAGISWQAWKNGGNYYRGKIIEMLAVAGRVET